MSQSIDPLTTKCGKCRIKPCALICQECPSERGEQARYCYSCYNLHHDEKNIFHQKQSISYSNIKASFSPRRVSFNTEDLSRTSGLSKSKYLSSTKASPYKRDLFQSHVISTPLNHQHMSSSTYYKNQQPNDSIEKRIRESRKKEVIMKLNELNTKLSPNISLSQQSLFQHRYKDYLTTMRSPPTKDYAETPSYTTSNFKFPEEKIEKSSIFTKKFQPNNTTNNNFSTQTPLPTENKESRRNDENIRKLEEEKKKLQDEINETKQAILDEDKRFAENETLKNQIIDEETKKFNLLNEEVKKNTEDYDAQVRELAFNLRSIKEEYESKLQDFEKLLRNSTGTIEKLQESIVLARKKEKEQPKKQGNQKSDDEIISELKNEVSKKKEILEKFKQGVILSNQKCQEVSQTLDKIINSKEKIVQELVKDNQQKDEDIGKLHEIVENFKQMFDELNVQEKAREIIMEALEKAKADGEIDDGEKEED